MKDNLERRISSLFLSAPYPGKQKFSGQPTGLLYALSVLAERKEREYGDKRDVSREIEVWCPDGTDNFDSSALKKELREYIKEKSPKIVGISTFSISYRNAVSIKDLVKEASPDTIVVFGGAHEDNYVKYYRENGKVDADFVMAGDAPYMLDKLYEITEGNMDASVEKIKEEVLKRREEFGELKGAGVMLFNKGKKLEEVFTQTKVKDSRQRKPLSLDEIPIMPRYLLKEEEILAKQFSIFDKKKTAQVMAGKGCPYACNFCSEGIKKVWYDEDSPRSTNPRRSLSHLEKELQELKDRGYEAVFFDDSTFFAKPKDYLEKVSDLMKKYGFEWACQTTQRSIHQEKGLLGKMKESGLKYIYLGVEHYDGRIRDAFGKSGGSKFGRFSIEETLDLLKENGIDVGMSLTFGHPNPEAEDERTYETEETAKQSIDKTAELAKKYDNIRGVSINIITYHPGTPISEKYEEKVGNIDYTANPNMEKPFRMIEEGMGPHPLGMTKELAEYIVTYAKDRLGRKLWI